MTLWWRRKEGAAQAVCSGVDGGRSCVLKGLELSLLPRLDDPELWQKGVELLGIFR